MVGKEGLVIIGDLAFDIKKQAGLEHTSIGGGVYGSVIGATTYCHDVGIVAPVGEDFPIDALRRTGADITGVTVFQGEKTARFTLEITADNQRIVTSSTGIIDVAHIDTFPDSYRDVAYIHLSTSHPTKYLAWLEYLRQHAVMSKISVDAFENYAREQPRLLLDSFARSDLIFMNEEELSLLGCETVFSYAKPVVLKKGIGGADYIDQYSVIHVDAPSVTVKDTTGAGDVLAGAFIGQLVQGLSIEESLVRAVALASQSVTEVGLEHLLPDHDLLLR